MIAKKSEIIDSINQMPIEFKTELIEKLLLSLNTQSNKFPKLWESEVERRIEDIRHDKALLIDGEEFFNEIKNKLK